MTEKNRAIIYFACNRFYPNEPCKYYESDSINNCIHAKIPGMLCLNPAARLEAVAKFLFCSNPIPPTIQEEVEESEVLQAIKGLRGLIDMNKKDDFCDFEEKMIQSIARANSLQPDDLKLPIKK